MQIALLNNRGLQAAYNELGVAEADRVQASLPPNPTFSLSRIAGSVETRDRAPDRRRHSCACDAAGAHATSRPTASVRRSCAPPRKRCASRPRRAAPSTARSRPETVGFLAQAQAAAEIGDAARQAPRRDRRHEQARPGARSGVLRRAHGAARHRAPARRERTRAPDPRCSDCGATISISSCRVRCRRCRSAPRALPAVETEAVAPPRRSADRADRSSTRWPSPTG